MMTATQFFVSTGGNVGHGVTTSNWRDIKTDGFRVALASPTRASPDELQLRVDDFQVAATRLLLEQDLEQGESEIRVFVRTQSIATVLGHKSPKTHPSIAEQLIELAAALSLNKSQLAEVLDISRPTLYEWQAGKEPHESKVVRLKKVFELINRAGIKGSHPLNSRFVRKAADHTDPTLLELLSAPQFDDAKILQSLHEAQEQTRKTAAEDALRMERRRERGYDEPTAEDLRARLALNIAQKEWPK